MMMNVWNGNKCKIIITKKNDEKLMIIMIDDNSSTIKLFIIKISG